MELRKCSEREAVCELILAGQETGSGTAGISEALMDLLAGNQDRCDERGPEHAAAVERWAHLIEARAGCDCAAQHKPTVLASDVAIRYGAVNNYTRC